MSAVHRNYPAQNRAGHGDNQDNGKYKKEHTNSCWEKITACWSSCCPWCCTTPDTDKILSGKVERTGSTIGELPIFGPPPGKFSPRDPEDRSLGRNDQPSVTHNQPSTSSVVRSNPHNVSFVDSTQDGDLPSTYESTNTLPVPQPRQPLKGLDGGELPSTFESTNSAPAPQNPPPSPTSKSKSKADGGDLPSTHDTGPQDPTSLQSTSLGAVNPHSEYEED